MSQRIAAFLGLCQVYFEAVEGGVLSNSVDYKK